MDSLAGAGQATSPSAASAKASLPPPSKRRVVKLADDADEVLAKCRKLRDELRRKQMKQSVGGTGDSESDDEWDIDFDSKKKAAAVKSDVDATAGATTAKGKTAKTQQLSLSQLKSKTSEDGKAIVEVVEMNTTEVIEGIENVAVTIAHQVLAKQGFQLNIPCELFANWLHPSITLLHILL